jgi:tRNA U38,U39,U40 pseudouridine synthase TruA
MKAPDVQFTRYLCGIQYTGTKFSGFGRNNTAILPSVYTFMENSLVRFCGNRKFNNLIGSSR